MKRNNYAMWQEEEEAFHHIYEKYNEMILHSALSYLKDIQSARDIVQQVFIKVWERRDTIGEIDNFQDYIAVISRNLIYDQFRKEKAERRKLSEMTERNTVRYLNNSSSLAEEHQYNALFRAAVDLLPPQQKRVYLLIENDALSYEKTAGVLGLSRLTVKKHLELARRSVRDYILPFLHD